MSARPDEVLRAAAAAPTPAGAEVEMIFEQHDYQFDRDGRQRRAVRRVFRYLTEKGVENWSSTEADWSAGCEERPEIRARVIAPDGQAHPLDPETIGEVPVDQDNPNLMSDQKLLRAPLPAIEVGAVVEEEIVSREKRPFFDYGMVERLLLAESYPTRKFRLIVAYPAVLPLRYEVLGSELKPDRSEDHGIVTLRFEAGPCPARPTPEPFQPPEADRWPEVVFSTGKSWSEVASRYAALVEAQLKPDAVRPLVRETVGQETDRRKIVAALLAAVRGHVRYTGIEFGKAALVPRAPHDTLARRYGDCKDQSALLVAMLRVAGIGADVALLRTGRFSDVVPGLPGLGDFDHAIVYLHGDEPMWIDPSARCVPAGRLPLVDQGRWAMVANPETRQLVRTPRMDYRQNFSSETFEVFLAEGGKARVRATVAGSGPCDEDMREQYASQSTKNLRKVWRDFFKEQYRTQSLARLEYSSPLDLSKPFRVVAEATDARIGQFQDAEATVSIQPDTLFDRLPGLFRGEESDKEEDDHGPRPSQPLGNDRHSPLVLPEPHVRQVEFRIAPPPGFVVRSLPDPGTRHYGPAAISQQFEEAADGSVVATFRLDTGPGTFTAGEVNVLRRAIDELGGEGGVWEVKLALEHVVDRHLAAGRMKEALAECRRLTGQYPNQVIQHRRFAQVLLKAGLGDAAREEARRAVELDPKSPAAHAALARILTYDPAGRHFQPGMDWQAAAAEYRKSLELDGADAAVRMDWAILLEHNEDGRRYSPDARLEEAVGEYRKAQQQLGSRNAIESLDLNLAMLLLHLEKYAEVEKLAARPATSLAWKALAAAAVAAQRGPAEARQKATELTRGAKERRSVLEAASGHLEDARLYAPAAALLEAAAASAPNAAELRARAEAIGRLRRFGEADLAPGGPVRVVQQLLLAVLLDGRAKQQLPRLFAKNTDPPDQAAVVEELRHALGPLVDQERQDQLPPQRMADMLSQIELVSEGSETTGYRIRARNEDMKELAWYVVVEEGGHRLLAPGCGQANLGAMSLARLDRNDPEGAARWLRWAADAKGHPTRDRVPLVGGSLRITAALLLAEGRHPQPAIPILVAARNGSRPPADAYCIDEALTHAYSGAGRPDDALRVLGEMDPRGVTFDIKDLARHRIASVCGLARSLMEAGKFPDAERLIRPLAREPNPAWELFDCLARNALAGGSAGQQALDDALAAVRQSAYEHPGCLATLAMVYAELGKTSDAQEALYRGLALRGGPPGDSDRYVLGRVAEHYGLDDVAAGQYRQVALAARPARDGVYVLAQRRLKTMGKL
jgi:hypothetical protein